MSYKTTCPKCGGNDFYVTPSNGVGYCFHCTYFEREGEEKTAVQSISCSVETLRAFYTKLADYYHSCITPEVRTYLHSRGYDDGTIQLLKLGYIPDEPLKQVDPTLGKDSGLYVHGKAVLGNRVSFPYIVKNIVVDIRGRALDKNDPIRYKSPIGTASVRGADYGYNHTDASEDHVITEGEIKAGIASQAGVKCVALPGIVSWRPMLKQTVKQTIIFDSTRNRNTREITFRAIDKLAVRLYNPYVAVLPLGSEDKMDIDSFILKRGEQELKTIVNNALPYDEWARIQRRPNVHGHYS
jgi:DNA primase